MQAKDPAIIVEQNTEKTKICKKNSKNTQYEGTDN
jgi:hypothetical protein